MKALIFSLFFLPTLAGAAAVKPESEAGRKLIQRLADNASSSFVLQTEMLEKEGSSLAEIGASCEEAKKNLLDDLSLLELSTASDLQAAKSALERANCGSQGEAEGKELHQAQNQFFAATAYLRSIASVHQ